MTRSEFDAHFELVPKQAAWTDPAPARPGRGRKPQGRFAAALARFLARLLGL